MFPRSRPGVRKRKASTAVHAADDNQGGPTWAIRGVHGYAHRRGAYTHAHDVGAASARQVGRRKMAPRQGPTVAAAHDYINQNEILKMNQQQKKYALERITEIYKKKSAAIKEKHTTKAVRLSPQERLKAFKSGKFKIRPDASTIGSYTDVVDIITFNDEAPEKADDKKISALQDALDKEYNRVRDEIVLGDPGAALELIRKFEQ